MIYKQTFHYLYFCIRYDSNREREQGRRRKTRKERTQPSKEIAKIILWLIFIHPICIVFLNGIISSRLLLVWEVCAL